ncbi:MAG: FHA domain-containing protein [Planctomycetes bacterium]|nr:FHA domain-containing protein [Planctomycetota bacterium]
MQPLREFVEDNAQLDRAAFEAAHTTPYLIVRFPRPEARSEDSSFLTRALSLEEIKTGSRRFEAWVVPVAKRQDSNAFATMITLGRAGNNDVVLQHASVSKFHAYLRHMGSNWTVSDAGSRNGTLLDDRKLPPERSFPLHSGAKIVLSEAVNLEFLLPEQLYDVVQAGGVAG